MRVLPLVVVQLFGLQLLLRHPPGAARRTLKRIAMIFIVSGTVAVPLLRFAIDDPRAFWQRTATRMTQAEQPYGAGVGERLAYNAWNAVGMLWWRGGNAWFMGPPQQPALDPLTSLWLAVGCLVLLREPPNDAGGSTGLRSCRFRCCCCLPRWRWRFRWRCPR